jgi:hypothetical protein
VKKEKKRAIIENKHQGNQTEAMKSRAQPLHLMGVGCICPERHPTVKGLVFEIRGKTKKPIYSNKVLKQKVDKRVLGDAD